MKTSNQQHDSDRVEHVSQALVVSVVDCGNDGGKDAASDEPIDLLDVVVRVWAARDARPPNRD